MSERAYQTRAGMWGPEDTFIGVVNWGAREFDVRPRPEKKAS
jgi:hypothetical protein